MWTIIRELTQRGYHVKLDCMPAGRERKPIYPADKEVGTGKQWYMTLQAKGTQVFTGYGQSATQACSEAMKKAGIQLSGVTI